MKITEIQENIIISIASHKPNKRVVWGRRELFNLGLLKQNLNDFWAGIGLNRIKHQMEDVRSLLTPFHVH